MTRFEAVLMLIGFAIGLYLCAWMLVSRALGRRRIPERLVFPEAPENASPGSVVPFHVEPGTHVEMPGVSARPPSAIEMLMASDSISVDAQRRRLMREGFRAIYFPPRLTDWLTADPDDDLFQWPTTPPSAVIFDQDNPRPWAHEQEAGSGD